MKIWKVIIATLVIFAAGFVTGSLVKKRPAPAVPAPAPVRTEPPNPLLLQQRFLEHRMKRELDLTPEQAERIEKIFADSRERLKILMDLIGPELQGELGDVRDRIRAELRPDQQDRFEQLLKGRRGEGRRGPPMLEDGPRERDWDRERDRDRRKEPGPGSTSPPPQA